MCDNSEILEMITSAINNNAIILDPECIDTNLQNIEIKIRKKKNNIYTVTGEIYKYEVYVNNRYCIPPMVHLLLTLLEKEDLMKENLIKVSYADGSEEKLYSPYEFVAEYGDDIEFYGKLLRAIRHQPGGIEYVKEIEEKCVKVDGTHATNIEIIDERKKLAQGEIQQCRLIKIGKKTVGFHQFLHNCCTKEEQEYWYDYKFPQ